MKSEVEKERSRVTFGVLLIAFGTVFLLGQFAQRGVLPYFHWWPGIVIAVGAAHALTARSTRTAISGGTLMLIGLWLFACVNHWYGLTFRIGWPIVLVIVGIEIILLSIFARRGAHAGEEQSHV